MKEKLREPRVYLCVAIWILTVLPWFNVSVSTSVGGFSADSAQSFSGLDGLKCSVFGVGVLLLPLLLLLVEFFLNNQIKPTIVYLIGSVLGIVFMFLASLYVKNLGNVNVSGGGISAETKVSMTIGFWIALLVFIAIIVVTIIKDFALGKDDLKEKGIKGMFSEVASQVKEEAVSAAGDMKSVDVSKLQDTIQNTVQNVAGKNMQTIPCPNCGSAVGVGKKFCVKCGYKMEADSGNSGTTKQEGNASKSQMDRPKTKKVQSIQENMTVSAYIATLLKIRCDKCGAEVPAKTKFCPDCGEKVVIMEEPKNCEKCNAPLIPGKKFCSECGEVVKKKKLQTNCIHCNAELIYGKKFCVECGAKICEEA